MPREMRRCFLTGDVYADGRRHGYGCPHHTDLKRNGGKQTETQLRSYYPGQRRDYPYGRYCCGFCRIRQDVITVAGDGPARPDRAEPAVNEAPSRRHQPRRRGGSIWMGMLGAFVGAGVCSGNEWPVLAGIVAGGLAGYWWRGVLKVVLAIVVLLIAGGIVLAVLEQ